MKLIYYKGIKSKQELEQINLLDKLTYSDKYLLRIEDYEKRLEKNPNQIYIVKNEMRVVIGYLSIIPLTYEAYMRIKNGELDKEVITPNVILGEDEKREYYYWDSIIVDPKYRRYKVGKKLVRIAMNDIINDNKDFKKIMAHVISKGGVNITKKYGLNLKYYLDSNTAVVEKVLNRKSNIKKKIYRNNDKRVKEQSGKYINKSFKVYGY